MLLLFLAAGRWALATLSKQTLGNWMPPAFSLQVCREVSTHNTNAHTYTYK